MNSKEKIQNRFPQWKEILTEKQIQDGVQECANNLNQRFKCCKEKIVLVGILKGVLLFMSDLTLLLEFEHSWYFLDLSSYKNSQTRGKTEISTHICPEKFQDVHVIIIDELFDKGETLHDAKEAIISKGQVPPERIVTCTLFVKDKEVKFPFPDFFAITLVDVWVVGYGLDHLGEYRNLKNLYAVPKSAGMEKTRGDLIIFGDDADKSTSSENEA